MPTFQNYATVSYQGRTAVSNLVTGEIAASLRMTKTAVTDTYEPGDSITYAVSILNSGSTELSGLTLSDDLGAYQFGAQTLTPLDYAAGSARVYIDGELQDAPAALAGPPLRITGLSVPSGGNTIVLYTARTNAYAPGCSEGQIMNTATLFGTGITEALQSSAAVTPSCNADLKITKTVQPAMVRENGVITYAFHITNLGGLPAEGSDNVTVSDSFDPVLHDITVTLNGQILSDSQYAYDATSGVFSTVPGVVTIPAASFAQDPATGIWTRSPGEATLTVSGRI
jgi:uncharacterized repeat protein (TIGR01451 family)